ncbi:hypothetical protein FRC03_009040 [Tulasnella sp. 419]|nr:hypothetical protein FRC03_009040 [Tulasnella sp. 419]
MKSPSANTLHSKKVWEGLYKYLLNKPIGVPHPFDAATKLEDNPDPQSSVYFESCLNSWDYVCAAMQPRNIFDPSDAAPQIDEEKLSSSLKELLYKRLAWPLLDWFLHEVRKKQYLIEEEIDSHMSSWEATGDIDSVATMLSRVLQLWEAWAKHTPWFNRYHVDGVLTFRRHCMVHLNAYAPLNFRDALRQLIVSTLSPDSSEERNQKIFHDIGSLGLIADQEHLITGVVKGHIANRVQETCAGAWNEPKWTELKQWFDETLQPWLNIAYIRDWMAPPDVQAMLEPVAAKYQWHMCEAMCSLRISEIFDIIVDYPESSPALLDLRECLFQTGQRREVVESLRSSTKKRLLHPGADTKDIITQYISTIRCLRILDPQGSLLFSVADPIRKYLRARPDTIRTIVQSLVDPNSEFVAGEDEVKPLQDTQWMHDDYADFSWMPEPADAEPEFRTTRATDIISTLVSIYDSRDLFVKELQVLLAKRLLEARNEDHEAEVRNLEILKLRFGDAPLQVCDVMMKDITDSRRSNQQIQTAVNADGDQLPVQTTIISRLFWPPIPSSSLVMPGQLRKLQESYARRFNTHKPDRKVRFMSNVGTVSLNIELSDRTLDLDVTPLQAAVIELFSAKDIWFTDDLAKELGGIDIPTLDKALEFWIDQGVLKSLPDRQYQLLEVAEEGAQAPRLPKPAVPEEPMVNEAEKAEAEKMRVFWQFIQGMLTNFPSLPLDRIHAMLRLAPNYDRTKEQLAAFMEDLKREGVVDFRDGSWRLIKRG